MFGGIRMNNNAVFFLLLFILYFILMISYNIFSINKKNVDFVYQDKRCNKLKKVFLAELKKKKNHCYSRKIFNYLKKRRYLLLFNSMIINDEVLDDNYKCVDVVNSFVDTFNRLSIYYLRKDRLSKVYYAYSLSLYNIPNNASYAFLFNLLIKGDYEGIYNAFNTICIYGDLKRLIASIKIINDKIEDFNTDLISNILLRYNGDKIELANTFKSSLLDFDVNMQLVIIKYFVNIRFDCGKFLFEILKKKNTSRELRLELVRYYKKIKFDDVTEFLYNIVECSNDLEFVILAIDTLACYNYVRTSEVLKKKIDNKNYMVSYQAVRSLLILDGYDEFDDDFEKKVLKTIEFIKDKR